MDRLKWWRDARFGMFVHWGLYTVDGLDCWKMFDMGIPVQEYIQRFETRFNPKKFDADALAGLAKEAGCKYVVMGTRHHEGYCLWNTKTTRLSSVQMTPRRDFIAEYVKALRKAGLKVGFYYSLLDWRYQAYFDGPKNNPEGWAKLVDLVHKQVEELMTDYGKIDVLWYDGGWPYRWGYSPTQEEIAEAWRSPELNKMVFQLQPHIIMNNRSYPSSSGDFGTPEQHIVAENRPWELCDTMADLWGGAPQDLNRKSVREVHGRLLTCVSRGGNLLLNIGPNADGSIQGWQAKIMKQIGAWMKTHSEAIYGCGAVNASPFNNNLAPWRTTRKGNTLYMHLIRYPGEEFSIGNLHDLHLISAVLMDTGEKLEIIHEPTRDIIRGLPRKAPDPLASVVKIRTRSKNDAERKRQRFIGLDDPEGLLCE